MAEFKVKVGDKVAEIYRSKVTSINTVERITKTLAVLDNGCRVMLRNGYRYGSSNWDVTWFRKAKECDFLELEAKRARMSIEDSLRKLTDEQAIKVFELINSFNEQDK